MKKRLLACVTAGVLGVGMMSAGAFAATEVSESNQIIVSVDTDKESYSNLSMVQKNQVYGI